MTRIYEEQPISSPGVWNRMEYRPLEGFVFAVTPFNFTAIGGNLPDERRADGQHGRLEAGVDRGLLGPLHACSCCEEAGLPDGVINLVYGPGARDRRRGAREPRPRGRPLHRLDRRLPVDVADGRREHRALPQLPAHRRRDRRQGLHRRPPLRRRRRASRRRSSAARSSTRARSARPRRACSCRANLWPELRERLAEQVGDADDGRRRRLRNFMGAVIDASSFATQKEAIEEARADGDSTIVVGGGVRRQRRLLRRADGDRDRRSRLPAAARRALRPGRDRATSTPTASTRTRSSSSTGGSPYGLTGAIFARDRARDRGGAASGSSYAAGNFYVNDKPTGAVVGQQPFGGARASGTNDKAGSMWNLIRWVSPRTIKETFVPPTDYRYPFMVPIRPVRSLERALATRAGPRGQRRCGTTHDSSRGRPCAAARRSAARSSPAAGHAFELLLRRGEERARPSRSGASARAAAPARRP